MSQQMCFPGGSVTRSGIYVAFHKEHRRPHDLLFLEGEKFPACNTCRNEVRYTLKQAAPYILEDNDFR
jgi:hypothetical protein